MNELIELLRTTADAGWLVFCGLAVTALGFLAFDRRPRTTVGSQKAVEEPAETTVRRAA